MIKNIWSLGLLRNGKIYPSKELAMTAFARTTNDGVAKLVRYIGNDEDGNSVIRTIVGVYANANEIDESNGGQSSYTIIDIDGISDDITNLQSQINVVNDLIGVGIPGETLTSAINAINAKIGEGFSPTHTIADALVALAQELTNTLTVSLEVATVPSSGCSKTYVLYQGIGSGKTEIGQIDIPSDLVVKEGSIVHGYWSGDTFTEDVHGPDTAIKLIIGEHSDPVYINTKDLVVFYTGGNGIEIDNDNDKISIKRDPTSERFLIVDADGIKVQGIQEAINASKLDASDGITIYADKIKAVAAMYSVPGVRNPIFVDEDGIKFLDKIDMGYYDTSYVDAFEPIDIDYITDKANTELIINTSDVLNYLTNNTSSDYFYKIDAADVSALSDNIFLNSLTEININNLKLVGALNTHRTHIQYNCPVVNLTKVHYGEGDFAFNIYDGGRNLSEAVKVFNASDVKVDNLSLSSNAFDVISVANNARIYVKDSRFNLAAGTSAVMRLSNPTNATGVTVVFENIEWTYENSPLPRNWDYAGIIKYQPYDTDAALSGDYSAMNTWKFIFRNCKYNGVKVDALNFGEHNQVMYIYKYYGGTTEIIPVPSTFNIIFE